MEFEHLSKRALEIRDAYAQLESQRYGRFWTSEELALGFMGDVGDLMKLIQACEGVRDISDARAKLAHELADCLWSVMVLANAYHIDLEKAFLETMEHLENHIRPKTQ
jgi:NTP pyrophosphatase (non-canonical NTP hydrolase)